MTPHTFRNRRDAGRQLAVRVAALVDYSTSEHSVIVLGLPRGGVPVAYEVAKLLGAPLDVMPVRKLGTPGFEEFALGAIAAFNGDTAQILNEEALRQHPEAWLLIDQIVRQERIELLRRRRAYRGSRPPLHLAGLDVVLVDDGLATGATMRAAILAARQAHAHRIITAVPVASTEACAYLRHEADACACIVETEQMYAVGMWYDDFSPTGDQDVIDLLADAERRSAHQLASATG